MNKILSTARAVSSLLIPMTDVHSLAPSHHCAQIWQAKIQYSCQNMARLSAQDWYTMASHTVTLKAIVAKPTVAWLNTLAHNDEVWLACACLSTNPKNILQVKAACFLCFTE